MSGTVQEQIQWMVRKNSPHQAPEPGHASAPSGITVLGPFVTDQIHEMIEQGMLEADDEICPENSYWFGLHEVLEVKRFLGIDGFSVPRATLAAADEESTQPDLETTKPDLARTDEDKTPPGLMPDHLQGPNTPADATGILTIKRPAAPPRPAAVAASAGGRKAAAKAAPVARPASAQELSSKFQRVAPAPLAYSNPETESVDRSGFMGMEKSQVWAIVIIGAGILALIAVVWVIKSLRA
ncbi:MAG: hypothetical protein HY074_03685 [Deltaproteobacteria bacterium]|nr:hypothetical protein [Deltaproteobacteria bacterium]